MNNLAVEAAIKNLRANGSPFTLRSIDLAKAFDCVSTQSIIDILMRKGIDHHTISYIKNLYKDIRTCLECCGQKLDRVHIQRGTKQGDPMSGLLFNLVLDDLLNDLQKTEGIKIDSGNIVVLTFADIIIFSKNPDQMKTKIFMLETYFDKHKLEVNVKKCIARQVLRAQGTKRTALVP